MPVPADTQLFRYTVLTQSNDMTGATSSVDVLAFYFVEEKSFTFFKDGQHSVVYAVPTERVMFIQRGEPV